MSVYTLDIDTFNTILYLNRSDLICSTAKYNCDLTSPSAQTNFVLASLTSSDSQNVSNGIVCKRAGFYTISYHLNFVSNLLLTDPLFCADKNHLIFSVVIGGGVQGNVYTIVDGIPQSTTLFSVTDMLLGPSVKTKVYTANGTYIIFCPLGATIQFTVSNIVATRFGSGITTQILEEFTNTDGMIPATITLTPVVF